MDSVIELSDNLFILRVVHMSACIRVQACIRVHIHVTNGKPVRRLSE